MFGKIVPQWQFYQTFPNIETVFLKFCNIIWRSSEYCGILFAYGNHCSTSKRCHVDYKFGIVLLCIRQSIGKNQSAFGIGVGNLDGRTIVHSDNVLGNIRCSSYPIFCCWHKSVNLHRNLCHSERSYCADHSSTTSLVALHCIHRTRWLQVVATSVEHKSLADKNIRTLVYCIFGFPFQYAECRRLNATAVYGKKSAHFQALNLHLVEYFGLKSARLANFLDGFCQFLGCHVRQRLVYNVACNENTLYKTIDAGNFLFAGITANLHFRQRNVFLFRQIFVEAIVCKFYSLCQINTKVIASKVDNAYRRIFLSIKRIGNRTSAHANALALLVK